jgi:hypothetical protein
MVPIGAQFDTTQKKASPALVLLPTVILAPTIMSGTVRLPVT